MIRQVEEVVPGLYRLTRGMQGVNAYLWTGTDGKRDDTIVLFDCGWPWSGTPLVANLAAIGYRPQDVGLVAVTHDDIDHTGRLAPLQAISGCQVIAHELEAPRLAGSSWRRIPGSGARLDWVTGVSGLLYRRWPHHPVPVSSRLLDGFEAAPGWTVIHTPGHTPGHTAYFNAQNGVLLAGDALGPSPGGGIRKAAPVYAEDTAEVARSVLKLAELDSRLICCGHGAPVRASKAELRQLADVEPPP